MTARSTDEASAQLLALLDKFPPGEWFTAGNDDDDEHPWWIYAFEQWVGDPDESETHPIGAVHCPPDHRSGFDAENDLAEFVAVARNAIPELVESRERAIRWAVTLESQLAEIAALHKSVYWGDPTHLHCGTCVNDDGEALAWPCPTVAALTGSTE